MSKNIKDVVDDGFLKLSVYSQKQKEILGRGDNFVKGHPEGLLERLCATAQNSFMTEIDKCIERTIAACEDNYREIERSQLQSQDALKDYLTTRIQSIQISLDSSHSHILSEASDRLDVLFLRVKNEVESSRRGLMVDADTVLCEADQKLRGSISLLNKMQSESSIKVALLEHELLAKLSESFSDLVQDAEKMRVSSRNSIETVIANAFSDISEAGSDIDDRFALAVEKVREHSKEERKNFECLLLAFYDEKLGQSIVELQEQDEEVLSDLENQAKQLKGDLLADLAVHNTAMQKLANDESSVLSKIQASILRQAETRFEEIAMNEARAKARPSAVERVYLELSKEFELLVESRTESMQKLLSDHTRRLRDTADESISSLFVALDEIKTEIFEFFEQQEFEWISEECELRDLIAKQEVLMNKLSVAAERISDEGSVA